MDKTTNTNHNNTEVAMKSTKNEINRAALSGMEQYALADIVNRSGEQCGPVITPDNIEYVPWQHLLHCVDNALEFLEDGAMDHNAEYRDVMLRTIAKIHRVRTDLSVGYPYLSLKTGEWVTPPPADYAKEAHDYYHRNH